MQDRNAEFLNIKHGNVLSHLVVIMNNTKFYEDQYG
jgi:hypothetical protein